MIKSYLKEKASLIDRSLNQITNELPDVPEKLLESMRYSLLAGGKRLRPILVLATIEALGENEAIGVPFACAIEMIHTYSLIHDDLPAMDNDDYRRGRLTNHKVYGDAMAILAGDALLTEAFGLIVRGAKEANLSQECFIRILEDAVLSAGASGMVGGQVRDILSDGEVVELQQLEKIHRHKTGDLIAFSIRTGAYLGKASKETLEALTRFAYNLGLAFQIQDDILDVIGDQEVIGKPVGSDEEKKKATYPAMIGLDQSKEKLQQLINDAKTSIRHLPDLNPDRLLQIADFLLHRDR